MSAIGHWLVQEGAIKDLVAFGIGAGCAWLVGFWRHVRRLERIENLLDTTRPGGLTDLLHAYQDAQAHPDGQAPSRDSRRGAPRK